MDYRLCDSCTVGAANDDWTALDYHHDPEAADAELVRISTRLEVWGWITPSHEADDSGYFDCDLCDDTQCGNGHIWIA